MVRGLFLFTVCFALAVSYWQLSLKLAYAPMLWVISGLTLINAATLLQLRRNPHTAAAPFIGQLLIDILGITLLLYFSGGADNPFVSYYLVPLCIAAATLNWRAAWPLMLFSLACYTLLFFYRIPLPDLAPHAAHGGHAAHMSTSGNGFSAHTVGMWFNFLISAALITFFVVRMAESLRQQNETLTQLKEDRLRDEQEKRIQEEKEREEAIARRKAEEAARLEAEAAAKAKARAAEAKSSSKRASGGNTAAAPDPSAPESSSPSRGGGKLRR